MRRAHFSVSGGKEQLITGGARGFDFENRRRSAFLLQATRDFAGGRGNADRQWFLQTGVSRAADGVCRGSAEASRRKSRRQRRLKIHHEGTKSTKPEEEFNRKGRKTRKKRCRPPAGRPAFLSHPS